MNSSARRRPAWVIGPKTLAVLSCAMALLAAQPTFAAESHLPRTHTVRSIEADAPLTTEPRRQSASKPQRERPTVETTRNRHELHVLATLEILHRLLLAELRVHAAPHQAPVVFEVIDSLLVPAPLAPQFTAATICPATHTPHETVFALTRCKLAPPHTA